MYKYSRKQIIKRWIGDGWSNPFANDLLAQKEDRKECKPIGNTNSGKYTGPYPTGTSGSTFTRIERPTPSPLEIEEINQLGFDYEIGNEEIRSSFYALQERIDKLISNQKKLYQYIKKL